MHTSSQEKQHTVHTHTPYLHGVDFFKQPLGSSLVFQECVFSAPVKRQLLPRGTLVLEPGHGEQHFKKTWVTSTPAHPAVLTHCITPAVTALETTGRTLA